MITSLEDLVDGLAQNNLDNYTHLLTGYIGSASFLKRVALLVTTLKAKNPNLTYGTLTFRFKIFIRDQFFMTHLLYIYNSFTYYIYLF